MRTLLHEFAKETTAHGIGKIDSADSVIWRIFWALAVMAGTGMVIYQGILLLGTYLSKPVKSDIDVTYSRVSHSLIKCESLQYHKWAFKNNKQVAYFICRELQEITKAKRALLFELCSLNLHAFLILTQLLMVVLNRVRGMLPYPSELALQSDPQLTSVLAIFTIFLFSFPLRQSSFLLWQYVILTCWKDRLSIILLKPRKSLRHLTISWKAKSETEKMNICLQFLEATPRLVHLINEGNSWRIPWKLIIQALKSIYPWVTLQWTLKRMQKIWSWGC